MPYIKKNSIKDNVSLIHSHASISSRIGVSNLQTIDSFFSSQTQIRQQPTLDPIFEHIKDDNITIDHLEQQTEQHTLDKQYPPNPQIFESEDEWLSSFASIFKHCIDIGFDKIPLTN